MIGVEGETRSEVTKDERSEGKEGRREEENTGGRRVDKLAASMIEAMNSSCGG